MKLQAMSGLAATLAGLTLAGAAAADPMADMPGMGHGGVMMGPMLGPMPAIYAGEADKPGAPVFQGLGAHRHRGKQGKQGGVSR